MLARGANTPNFHLPFSLFFFRVVKVVDICWAHSFFSSSSFVCLFFRFSFLFDCSCISSAFSRMSYFRMMFWTIPTETNDDGLYPADAVNCVGYGGKERIYNGRCCLFSLFVRSFIPSRHGTISPSSLEKNGALMCGLSSFVLSFLFLKTF